MKNKIFTKIILLVALIMAASPLMVQAESLSNIEARFPQVGDNRGQAGMLPPGTGEENTLVRSHIGSIGGMFHPHLSMDAIDSWVHSLLIYSLVSVNDNFMFDRGNAGYGPVLMDWDVNARTVTFTMRPDITIYWSDGIELTLDDLKYAYYFISHPQSPSPRFGEANGTANVVGARAFNEGRADSISGITLSEDRRSMTVRFIEGGFPPSALFAGILTTPIPRHHFEGIPIQEIPNHPHAREQMLGFGPFILETSSSESVLMRANPNYWQGVPQLDYVLNIAIHADDQVALMQSGGFDIGGITAANLPNHLNDRNIQILGRTSNGKAFYYFTLGAVRWTDYGSIYFTPRYDEHPINDARVRRAIGYAIDHDRLNQAHFNGLRVPATSILHPFNAAPWLDANNPGIGPLNRQRANALLDEAGLVWRSGEPFRRDTNGEPFHINFGFATSPTAAYVFEFHRADLAAVGIDFRLYGGELMAFSDLVARNINYAAYLSPNNDMHMWSMSWSMGANPSPQNLWDQNENFNLSRFNHDAFQAPIRRINSDAAWDPVYLADAYRAWSEAFYTYMPALYTNWLVGFTAINRRVANMTLNRSTFRPESFAWHRVGLTSTRPYTEPPTLPPVVETPVVVVPVETPAVPLMRLVVGNPQYTLRGTTRTSDVGVPAFVGNQVMVPMRLFTDNLGFTVEWNRVTRETTVRHDGITITVQVDQPMQNRAGEYIGTPIVINGRTMVPLHFIAEFILHPGAVEWNPISQVIYIYE